jgi:hypothetical protein
MPRLTRRVVGVVPLEVVAALAAVVQAVQGRLVVQARLAVQARLVVPRLRRRPPGAGPVAAFRSARPTSQVAGAADEAVAVAPVSRRACIAHRSAR